MISVLIVDDHELLREGVKKVLKRTEGLEIAAEAQTGREALQILARTPVDVVVLDITLPDLDGLEVLSHIRKRWSTLPVLIFTMHDEESLVLRFMKAGANGYLTKVDSPLELVEAIRVVASGRNYLTGWVGDVLLNDWSKGDAAPPHSQLSNREFSVFKLLAVGKRVGEIAEMLNLATPTVSTYRRRILQKLSLKSTAELIHYAVTNRLI